MQIVSVGKRPRIARRDWKEKEWRARVRYEIDEVGRRWGEGT